MYYNNIIIHVFYISLKDLKGGNSDNYDEYRIPTVVTILSTGLIIQRTH